VADIVPLWLSFAAVSSNQDVVAADPLLQRPSIVALANFKSSLHSFGSFSEISHNPVVSKLSFISSAGSTSSMARFCGKQAQFENEIKQASIEELK
jgi:hypothetical protein